MSTPALPPTYMLLFRNTGPEVFAHLSPDQRQQLVTRWNDWFEGLVAAGQASEGQPLETHIRVVSGAAGSRVVDGPYAESKEAVAGYVKLHVRSLDEATAIAQCHPGLEHGMKIEVRELTPHCHLGVNTNAAPAVAKA
ncbi:MAG: hypothetical protein KF715_04620 [Candidatus Didemnitutus sp.]|nr:hypothetical protein [Candidatus Didemnitutus sp.]